jgi:putative membrane protein
MSHKGEPKMGWGGHMGWGGGFMMILWFLLVAAVVYWVMQSAQKNKTVTGGTESALDIIKKRYARGEISKEDFDERKKNLL